MLCRERSSVLGPQSWGVWVRVQPGLWAHPGAVVAGGVAQQLLVRVLVRGDAVVVVLVVQVTLAPQRVVEGVWGRAGWVLSTGQGGVLSPTSLPSVPHLWG